MTKITVRSGALTDARGNSGCCVDKKGNVYCQWLLHGHPFCTSGCVPEEENA